MCLCCEVLWDLYRDVSATGRVFDDVSYGTTGLSDATKQFLQTTQVYSLTVGIAGLSCIMELTIYGPRALHQTARAPRHPI